MSESSYCRLERLYQVLASRRDADPAHSYTARLLAQGSKRIAQKIGEEAVEVLIEIVRGDKHQLAQESADLLYHLTLAWAAMGLRPSEVYEVLEARQNAKSLSSKTGLSTLSSAERVSRDKKSKLSSRFKNNRRPYEKIRNTAHHAAREGCPRLRSAAGKGVINPRVHSDGTKPILDDLRPFKAVRGTSKRPTIDGLRPTVRGASKTPRLARKKDRQSRPPLPR